MDNIKEILSDSYNIKVNSIAEAPRGFVAETYIIDAIEGKYFLKVMPKNRYSINVLQSLSVLKYLKDYGIDYINYPIENINKELFVQEDNAFFILFNYIEGGNSADYDLIEVYKKLIKIHKLSEQINEKVVMEDFKIKYIEDFELALEKHREIEIIKEFKDIDSFWSAFKMLSATLAGKKFPLFLTHGDTFGNIIKNGTDLYIIDWDDLILAPLERDLWFFAKNQEVVDLYKESFVDFEINQDVVRYYIFNRFFDDLLGFLELLDMNPGEERKREIIEDIRKDCFDWTYQLIKDF